VLVLVVVLDCFPSGQTEDEHDHEHDQEKSRRFFFRPRPVVVLDCFPAGQTSGLPIAIRHRVLINTIS
jgi:hypothetical protein